MPLPHNTLQIRHPTYEDLLTKKWRVYIEQPSLSYVQHIISTLVELAKEPYRFLLNYIVADNPQQDKLKIVLQTIHHVSLQTVQHALFCNPGIEFKKFKYAYCEPLPAYININSHFKHHPHKIHQSPTHTFPWNCAYVPYIIRSSPRTNIRYTKKRSIEGIHYTTTTDTPTSTIIPNAE